MKLPNVGSINQIAYVVPDIAKAVEWWTGVMGVGPFLLLRNLQFERSDYLGEERPVTFSAAIGYSGDVVVELIEPSGPSIFDDWLRAGRTGIQHICVFTEDFEATETALKARGAVRLQGATTSGGVIGYYDMTGDRSVILEVAALNADGKALFAMIRQAGATWDGEQRYITLPEHAAQAV